MASTREKGSGERYGLALSAINQIGARYPHECE